MPLSNGSTRHNKKKSSWPRCQLPTTPRIQRPWQTTPQHKTTARKTTTLGTLTIPREDWGTLGKIREQQKKPTHTVDGKSPAPLRMPKMKTFYPNIKTFSGIPSGVGFFPSTVGCMVHSMLEMEKNGRMHGTKGIWKMPTKNSLPDLAKQGFLP